MKDLSEKIKPLLILVFLVLSTLFFIGEFLNFGGRVRMNVEYIAVGLGIFLFAKTRSSLVWASGIMSIVLIISPFMIKYLGSVGAIASIALSIVIILLGLGIHTVKQLRKRVQTVTENITDNQEIKKGLSFFKKKDTQETSNTPQITIYPQHKINERLEQQIAFTSQSIPYVDHYYQTKNQDIIIAEYNGSVIKFNGDTRCVHSQIIGSTGTGKTLLLQRSVAQDLLNPNVSVFVLEPKGGDSSLVYQMKYLADRLGRKVYVVDPSSPTSSIILPLAGDNLDEVAEANVLSFVSYLGTEANEFYKKRQSSALKMAVKVVKILHGDEATYIDILELLRLSARGSELRQRALSQIDPNLHNLIHGDLAEYQEEYTENSRNAMQNYAGLIDYLKELTGNSDIRRILCTKKSEAGDRAVELRKVLNNGEIILITTSVGTTKQLGYTIGRLYMNFLQSEVFFRNSINDPNLPHIAVYVDEVQNYVNENFAELFEMSRSAKCALHVAHQGIEQLSRISKRLQQAIWTNARNKIIFGGIDAKDAKMVAEQIGTEYKLIGTRSYTVNTRTDENPYSETKSTLSEREEQRYKVHPSDITNLAGFNTQTMYAEVLVCGVDNNQPFYSLTRITPIKLDLMSRPTNAIEPTVSIETLSIEKEPIKENVEPKAVTVEKKPKKEVIVVDENTKIVKKENYTVKITKSNSLSSKPKKEVPKEDIVEVKEEVELKEEVGATKEVIEKEVTEEQVTQKKKKKITQQDEDILNDFLNKL